MPIDNIITIEYLYLLIISNLSLEYLYLFSIIYNYHSIYTY